MPPNERKKITTKLPIVNIRNANETSHLKLAAEVAHIISISKFDMLTTEHKYHSHGQDFQWDSVVFFFCTENKLIFQWIFLDHVVAKVEELVSFVRKSIILGKNHLSLNTR